MAEGPPLSLSEGENWDAMKAPPREPEVDEQPTRVLPPGEARSPDDQPTQVVPPAATDGAGLPAANGAESAAEGTALPSASGADQPDSDVPQLADGIELIGVYEGSGFKDAPYIARRADGQMVQLPPLLYAVAEEIDGLRTYEQVAEVVSERLKRGVTGGDVEYLAHEKLRPLGVLAEADGSTPELEKVDPLLALKFRAAVVPKWLSRALTTVFYPFFWPPVIVAVLAGLVAVDVWFFSIHGAAQSTRALLYNPALILMVLGLVVLATALHEIGHATATRYGGAEPGVMGVGIYIVWPAFYTDVTDAYRLGRGGRLRTDLGGVYFNVLFILGIVGAYALTGYEAMLILIPIQHMQIIQQFLPFLRLDGYYILSDLTGVPDMFQRMRPTLASLVPFKETDKKVHELKPWVRLAITAWVIALVPVMVFTFGMLLFNLPRMAATAWDSFWVQADKTSTAWDEGRTFNAGVSGMQAAFLLLPTAGMIATFGRMGKRVGGGAWNWSADSPFRRTGILAIAVAAAAVGGYVLLPNGDYVPIQPGEKGTIQGGVHEFGNVSAGRPSFTAEHEAQAGPLVYERDSTSGSGESPAGQTTTGSATTDSTTTVLTTTVTNDSTTSVATITTAVPAAGGTTTSSDGTTTSGTTTTGSTTTGSTTTSTTTGSTTTSTTTGSTTTSTTTTTDSTTTTTTPAPNQEVQP